MRKPSAKLHKLSLKLKHPAALWAPHNGKPTQSRCPAPAYLLELAKATEIDILIDGTFIHPDWKFLFLKFISKTGDIFPFPVDYGHTCIQVDWHYFTHEDGCGDGAAPPPYAEVAVPLTKKRPAQVATSPKSSTSPAPKRIFVDPDETAFDRGSPTEPNTPTTIDESFRSTIRPPARSPTPAPEPAQLDSVGNSLISRIFSNPQALAAITSRIASAVLPNLLQEILEEAQADIDGWVTEAHTELREQVDDARLDLQIARDDAMVEMQCKKDLLVEEIRDCTAESSCDDVMNHRAREGNDSDRNDGGDLERRYGTCPCPYNCEYWQELYSQNVQKDTAPSKHAVPPRNGKAASRRRSGKGGYVGLGDRL